VVGIVTLATVGYGDIVPKTSAGRLAGIASMCTGVAVLGVLVGSPASLFGFESSRPEPADSGGPETASGHPHDEARWIHDELAALGVRLRTVERALGELAERARSLGASRTDS
jgi:hypothetical protein